MAEFVDLKACLQTKPLHLTQPRVWDPVMQPNGSQNQLHIKSSGQPLKHKLPRPHPGDAKVFDPTQGSSSAKFNKSPKFI